MDSEIELKALEGSLDQCSRAAHAVINKKISQGQQSNCTHDVQPGKYDDCVIEDDDCYLTPENRSMTDFTSQVTNTQLSFKHGPQSELSILICDCSETNNIKLVRDYLKKLGPQSCSQINYQDSAGMTALHFAVSCKNFAAVKLLMEFGAQVNKPDSLGFTPLFQATGRYPNVEIAKYLLEKGKADVNHKNETGATPLHGAAFQRNIECVKLLLAWGADPCIEDEDGTNAFELTNDQAILTILHDSQIEINARRDTIDAVCSQCRQIPKDGLKRCSKCHTTLYCGKECQRKHWTQGGHKKWCPGFVIARPFRKGEDVGECVQISFYKVSGTDKSQVKVYQRNALNSLTKSDFLKERRFIVKAQLPIGPSTGEIMTYNVDRSVEGFIYPEEKGFDKIYRKIIDEGFKEIKAFFWAELCESFNGTFKVFPGKSAPYQLW